MHLVQLRSLLLIAICVRKSDQNCRVLADCNGGEARWQDLSRGTRGIPGKRGAPGLEGQKGEPGLGINITELKERLKDGNRGPKLFYYMSTLTWEMGKSFCNQFDRTLCTFDQVCPPYNGGRKLVGDVIHGDHWAPVLDSRNDWVEIGTHHTWPCRLHRTPAWKGRPTWGTTTESRPWKGYVFCCEPSAISEISTPDIRFQFIGKATTYASSLEHCESQGRRLCYSAEVCSASTPRLGTAAGSNWIAVRDRYNEWIQIGTAGGTCTVHGIKHGAATWGVRQNGALRDDVGFVYCCKSTT